MPFTIHKLKCDNGHYTNTVVGEGETLEENLKKFTLRTMCKSCCLPLHKCWCLFNFNHLNYNS
jgi:L-fucose isomerase-like protein